MLASKESASLSSKVAVTEPAKAGGVRGQTWDGLGLETELSSTILGRVRWTRKIH